MLPNYGAVVRLLSRTKGCGFAPNMALFCGVDPVREVPKVTRSAAAAIARQHNVLYLSDILGPTKNPKSVGGSTQKENPRGIRRLSAGKFSESGSAGCPYFDSASCANDDEKQNEDLIRRFYNYAQWCWQSRIDDVVNSVACAFYEHLPTTPVFRQDMSRRFGPSAFKELKNVFCYHLQVAPKTTLYKVRKKNELWKFTGS